MCLGGDAKAANQAAKNQYVRDVEKRKRTWMGNRDIYAAKGVRYKETLWASNRGADRAYGRNQMARYRAFGEVMSKNLKDLTEFTKNSKAAQSLAAGRTGRSVGRLGVVEMGALGRSYASRRSALTNLYADTMAGDIAIYEKLKATHSGERAKIALQPVPGVPIPAPVYRNPAMEGFKEALSIGSSVAGFFKP